MNWLIKRPVIFVLSLVSLFSCDDSNDLGTAYEGSLVDAVFTDTISIKASTVLANDSIIGYRIGNLLVGNFTIDKFGTTNTQSYLAVGPAGGSFAANAGTPDSVVLSLNYDEYYGDTTQNFTVEVRELGTLFKDEATYYTNNNNNLEALPSLLGTTTFVPAPKRKYVIKDTKTGVETKYSIPVRIKLNNELGQRIMALPSTTLSNPTEFAKAFKGIVLSSGANTNAALGFAPNAADSTYLRIYYTSSDNKKQKYNLAVTGTNARLNQITSNLTGSTLSSLRKSGDSISSVATNNETYLQESTGILTKITFPYINRFREKLNLTDLAINRAELIIPVKENPFYLPSPAAHLVETDKSNRILKTAGLPRVVREDPLETLSRDNMPQAAAIRYNKEKKAYIINVTRYVQDLIYNKQSVYGALTSKSLLLVPTSRTGALDATGKTVLEATGLYSSILQISGSDKIKLRLYFSKTN